MIREEITEMLELPCFKVYIVEVAEKFVAVITFSLFEVSSSTRISFSTSLWKLLTSPVGKVALVRWPSESYLQDTMLKSHENTSLLSCRYC